jgi:hypothetical protein
MRSSSVVDMPLRCACNCSGCRMLAGHADVALPVPICRLPNYSRGIRQKLHRLCNESDWKVPAPAILLGLMRFQT